MRDRTENSSGASRNPEPERRDDADEPRNFEQEVSDLDTTYDAPFDEGINPIDDTEINEHGSER